MRWSSSDEHRQTDVGRLIGRYYSGPVVRGNGIMRKNPSGKDGEPRGESLFGGASRRRGLVGVVGAVVEGFADAVVLVEPLAQIDELTTAAAEGAMENLVATGVGDLPTAS
jgi:hypothetical protein